MKLKLISTFILSFIPIVLCQNQLSAYEDKIPYDLHDEHDKTDIFAIQLDSSEEDLDEEEEELEELEKYEQDK